jgi:hypothetical protein
MLMANLGVARNLLLSLIDPEWLMSILTFIAIVVALFEERIRSWVWKPKLIISIKNESPDCQSFIRSMNDWYEGTYLMRIRVWNKGSVEARGVEVFASRIEELDNREWKELSSFLPMNLNWSHFGNSTILLKSLPPETYKHCDIVTLSVFGDGKRRAAVNTFVSPTNRANELVVDKSYRIEIWVSASNAKMQKQKIQFSYSSDWKTRDPLERGVKIRVS